MNRQVVDHFWVRHDIKQISTKIELNRIKHCAKARGQINRPKAKQLEPDDFDGLDQSWIEQEPESVKDVQTI